ncbi:protein adenylyltransferase SelO [Pseudidiomarina sp.]|uniref:protein adenylyltransferase SelO n=1 Tax=Pseudidiomarina sp. TaxID=2081707 RepID=UPI003A97B45C
MPFRPEHSYQELSDQLCASCEPTAVQAPQWIAFNEALAAELELPENLWLSEQGLQVFSGNQVPEWAKPAALAYAGHQFANFVPQLGDGRALLLSEVVDKHQQRFDIQLKGSGRTPFSRGGDGRSPIGPVLREYTVSEAMHALGVPTTRALAAVATGELVRREQAEPGAILTRVAASHLRVGTAQYVLALKDFELLKNFADYVLQRHYPDAVSDEQPYLMLLRQVMNSQAKLIAKWMSIGFIHGVMNTDNMTLSGETIDYGPCAFMEAYDPATKFSFIDKRGRYAYQNQPAIGLWNIARFAETLLPLLADDPDQAVAIGTAEIEKFQGIYEQYYWQNMSAKIGLPVETAQPLVTRYLTLMQQQHIDFTLGFRYLGDSNQDRLQKLFNNSTDWQAWHADWLTAIGKRDITALKTKLNTVNPAYIPRNHLVQHVIEAASEQGSLIEFNRLNKALSKPYLERSEFADLMQPAAKEQAVTQTFCGT